MQLKLVQIGFRWNISNRATHGALAVKRTLRAKQHLDPLQIHRNQVNQQRDVAQVGCDCVADKTLPKAGSVQTANQYIRYFVPWAAINNSQARDKVRNLGNIV